MPKAIIEKPLQMTITIVEEQHSTVFRRVVAPEELTACCKDFEEEYGKQFRLLPDGGLVPAAISIERVKMGRVTMNKPKIGWQGCPYCRTPFVATIQPAVMTPVQTVVVTPAKE